MSDFFTFLKLQKPLKTPAMNPSRDWLIVVGFIGAVSAGMLVWSAFLFFGLRAGDIFQKITPIEKRGQTLNRKALKDMVQLYELRAATFDAGGNRPALKDPSK